MKLAIHHFVYSPPHHTNVMSVNRACVYAKEAGHDVEYAVLANALIDVQRSTSASRFLKSGADALVMVDADMEFDAQDVVGLAQRAIDCKGIVGSVASRREFGGGVNTRLVEGPRFELGEDRLIDALHVGTGLIAISRAALEQMVEKLRDHPDPLWRIYQARATLERRAPEKEFWTFFANTVMPTEAEGGAVSFGEDVAFCRRATLAGVPLKCWIKPLVKHWGHHGFTPSDSVYTLDALHRGQR